jgi:hypothetical protein
MSVTEEELRAALEEMLNCLKTFPIVSCQQMATQAEAAYRAGDLEACRAILMGGVQSLEFLGGLFASEVTK